MQSSLLNDELRAALIEKEAAGLRRDLRAVPEGVLDLASNDYLGLAHHPGVIEAACAAARQYGCGARASRLVSGHTPIHEQLEQELAVWKGCEAALVFPSGYQTNVAVITALARRGDIVFCDKRNHASLIDACRLAGAHGATVRYYNSLERLKTLTEKYEATPFEGRLIIVSDTVYSMDGDLADLPRLVRRATEIGAVLILDDAHGTGIMGANGFGAWEFWFGAIRGWEMSELREKYSPEPRPQRYYSAPVIHIGTLSKALGSQGGFVAASQTIIAWLVNAARPFIYSTGLAPANCGAALAAAKIVRRDWMLRHQLCQTTEKLARGLQAIGFDAQLHLSPIIPIMVGQAQRAVALSEALLQHGIWCPAIRPPTVPDGRSRLRLTANATLDEETIERILQIFAQVKNETS